MKKISYLGAVISLALIGCSNQTATANTAPTIKGVKDMQCVVYSTVDFLDGIAALDKEDGDLTPDMDIVITPHVDVKDGRATFSRVGQYTVDYVVSDSAGMKTIKSSSIDVVAREKYLDFVLPVGYSGEVSGKAKFTTCGLIENRFVVQATGHEVAEDVKINRTFSLKSNLQYTFKFTIDSKCEGKVKALANGVVCAEAMLEKGSHVLSFSHVVLSDEPTEDVAISLCFGGIASDIDLVIENLEIEYPQHEGEIINHTPDYVFTGRTISRIENGCEGETKVENSGKTAVLKITKPIEEIWLGGMFINTGVKVKRNVTYTVSFDVERELEEYYEVTIQRGQWNEIKFQTLYNPVDGRISVDITPDRASAGDLWVYVQSGTKANTIKVSNLKVEEHLNATGVDDYPIETYRVSHWDGWSPVVSSKLGGFACEISEFPSSYGAIEVYSPKFFVAGSAGNYVISFRAKATAPVEIVIAGPLAGGWDPALMWAKITLTEEEAVYSFLCSGAGADSDYNIVWQFGSPNNQKYSDVRIDITDVSVDIRNWELDN